MRRQISAVSFDLALVISLPLSTGGQLTIEAGAVVVLDGEPLAGMRALPGASKTFTGAARANAIKPAGDPDRPFANAKFVKNQKPVPHPFMSGVMRKSNDIVSS